MISRCALPELYKGTQTPPDASKMRLSRMNAKQGRAGRLRATARRIAVFVIVIGCHLGLLVLVSGQALGGPEATGSTATNTDVIKLHFFRESTRSSSPVSVTTPTRYRAALQHSKTVPQKAAAASAAKRVSGMDAQASGQSRPGAPPIPLGHGFVEGTTNDGGFQQRLRDAKPSYGAPRLPGSDTPVVAGIRLVDPMEQGIGAVMRKTQRLFGIKNSHCIDVETWRSLTPQELSARHVSPVDIERIDERYACNAPPGLFF